MLRNHSFRYPSFQHSAKQQRARRASVVVKAEQSSRRNISERIEQLKRQNDSLKQAIGVFLDRPQDVGVVTGKKTGSWDGGSTAGLLDQLRKRPEEDGQAYEAASPTSSQEQEAAEPAEATAEAAEAPAGRSSSSITGTGSADSSITKTADAVEESAAVEGVEAVEESVAVEAVEDVVAAAAQAEAEAYAHATTRAASAATGGSSETSRSNSSTLAPGSSSNGTAVTSGRGAAVAVPAKPAALRTIHERVEQMERQHQQQQQQQQQQQAASTKQKQAVKPRATARRPPPACDTPLDIVFVSAEAAPWSKTGGLGDVMGALPQAMAARGHRVMVVTPRYTNGGKDAVKYKDAKPLAKSVWVELNSTWHELKYHCCHTGGVDYVFLEHIAFQREGTPYGDASGPYADNLFRFALLCLGALEAPLNLPIKRDRAGHPTNEVYGQNIMFVANDWHAALLPLLLAARFRPYGVYDAARCCLAIHNLAHQGSYEAHTFHDLGLPGEWYGTLEWENPTERHRKKTINVLKAGIVTSDLLLTVSQGYAAEITGMPQDARVDMLLAQRAPRLRGIVNGIDIAEWDPATDKHLAARFSADALSGKAVCKRALQREMRLPIEADVPLIGFIGRLDYQKGPDLVLDALPILANLDCQVVLLGTGASDYEERLRAASHEYGWFCRGHVGFSVPLSHKIIAGCDILLMPSRFEPCGLNQMYAMRYGTVPIAHATGGLTDTIHDYNPFSKGEGEGTGWTFSPAAVEPMVAAISTAVQVYRDQPDRWQALQQRGMADDCSWERAAQQYETVLTEAMADAVQYTRK